MIRQTRQYFTLFLTIIVIAGGFAGYYMVYLPQKKQTIDERNFRVLSKISENAIIKANSYAKNAHSNIRNALVETWWEGVIDGSEPDNMAPVLTLKDLNKKLGEKTFNPHIRIDSFRSQSHANLPEGIGKFQLNSERGSAWLAYLDTIKHFDQVPALNDLLEEEKTFYEFKFSFPLEKFFSSLTRHEFFDGYLVLNDTEIVYSTFNSGVVISNSDSLLTESDIQGISVSAIREIEISGIPYMLFVQPLDLTDNPWIVCGLVPRDEYNAEKFAVSSYTVFLISLILILALLALPFLKLNIMSRDERLTKGDAMLSGVSIIFSAALLTILFLHGHTFMENEHNHWNVQSQLKHVSEGIEVNLKEELIRATGMLEISSTYLNKLEKQIKTGKSEQFPLDAVNVRDPKNVSLETYSRRRFSLLTKKNEKLLELWAKERERDVKVLKQKIEVLDLSFRLAELERRALTDTTFSLDEGAKTQFKELKENTNDSIKKAEFEKLLKLQKKTLIKTVFKDSVDSWVNSSKSAIKLKMLLEELELRKDSAQFVGLDKTEFKLRKAGQYSANIYPYFNTISWIDRTGYQRHKWSSTNKISAHVNVSGRKYFKNLTADLAWNVPFMETPFYMESIVALNTGRQEAAISYLVKNDTLKTNTPIAAMTSELSSVMHPVLPAGYGFCIVNSDGEVQFHSSPERNLQENLLEETDYCSGLESSIYSRTDKHFSASYHGKTHDMYVKPLWSTSLFLVTFAEPSIMNTAHTQVISYSLVMYLIFFGLLLFQVAFIFIAQSRLTKLHSKKFKFSWLWPKHSKIKSYLAVFCINTLLIIYLYLAELSAMPSEKIYAVMFSAFYSVLFSFLLLDADNIRKRNHLPTLLLTVAPMVVFGLVSWQILGTVFDLQQQTGLAYLLVPILILILVVVQLTGTFDIRKYVSGIADKLISRLGLNVNTTYLPMTVSWLFLTVVVPIHFFFSIAYNQESEIITK